jgi:tetratricopeptide (TPR) repeat protein
METMMKKKIVMLITAAVISITANAQSVWKMQPTVLQTRWAKDVTPANVLKEYPRPQMVRNRWQNLNGLWDYSISKKDGPAPSKFDGKILVPFPIESALSGVKKELLPEQNLWYRRYFTKPALKSGERFKINFGAIDWEATIFINGQRAGIHQGGYTAFSLDITDLLKSGNNEIIIKVFDPSDTGIGPHGKQVLFPGSIYYTPSSGIWQTVWTEIVPQSSIDHLTITPDVDKASVNITVNSSSTEPVVVLLDRKTFKGKPNSIMSIPLQNMKLWSPDNPYLYHIEVKLGNDIVQSYFGMRKVSIKKDKKGIDRIYLNNKYTYNLGTLDQGFWPDGLYTAPTDEALAFDIKAIKAMGFNTIRKHIKVEPARWYYWADKLGMLVWQDMVNPNQALPEGAKPEFEKESGEIMEQLHNYPSITTWVLFNEKWGQYDQERLTKWIKDTDPSRLVNGHSGEYLYVNNELRSPSPNAYVNADMTDVHSYPYPKLSIKQVDKAQVCGEFGGIGVPIAGHIWDDLVAGWGYDGVVTPALMTKQYSKMLDTLVNLEKQGLSASVYTQPFDVESEQNGIMTYDRAIIKIPYTDIRRINSKVWPATKGSDLLALALHINVPQTNIKDYKARVSEFNNGKQDSTFLRGLAIMANSQNDKILVGRVVDKYISILKVLTEADNLKFISKFTTSTQDRSFAFLYNYLEKTNATTNNKDIKEILKTIIAKEYIDPIITGKNKMDGHDWESIAEKIAKFGELGEEKLLQNKTYYYYNTRDYTNLLSTAKGYLNRFPEAEGAMMLNNVAFTFFLITDNQSYLQSALNWSKRSIDKGPTMGLSKANQFDTYANILYKLGKTAEAIEYEENAMKLEPGNTEIKNNLEKMRKGEKTWNK